MCCEGTAVGLKLPEDGVNKHRNAQGKNKYVSEETRCSARQLVSKGMDHNYNENMIYCLHDSSASWRLE